MTSFRNVFTALLLVIAGSTQKELARQVTYLKAENRILRRRLPDRISLTQREKNRLIRFAKKCTLGAQWMVQQAAELVESTKTGGPKCKILLLDNDKKYSKFPRKPVKIAASPCENVIGS